LASQNGGAEGIRTPDLLLAKQALSRLSYSPNVH
jgi:site-specific DNA recombinase